MAQARTAARILVDQLIAQGVTHASCVPGESYLSVLVALIDSGIDLLTCRAEGGAAMMAEAHGKLTGRSEEHTSELQSLMRISYAVFCLQKKKNNTTTTTQYPKLLTYTTYKR